ncbi:MAG: ADP-heptose:LPS heptosyltransferase [Pseudoalteromonas tetraodonis]
MEKILTLQLKRIGDVILTLPALASLRRSVAPSAEISVVLVDGCAALAPLLPEGVRPLFYRRGKLNAGLWCEILFSKYSECFDFTGSDRSTLMARFSGAGVKICYRKSLDKNPVRKRVFNRVCEAAVRDHHTIDYHLALVDAEKARIDFEPTIPVDTQRAVDQILVEGGVGESFVVVHPGTARDEKYWPPERWAAVIDHLASDHRLQVVMTGSPDIREQDHLQAVKAACRSEIVDVSGRVDLVGLTELLRRARLVLGVDSAAMHLAALFGRPEIALFGPTNPFHWRPLHPKAQILLAGQDAPVEDFQPRHKAAPMESLTTDTVIRAIDNALG